MCKTVLEKICACTGGIIDPRHSDEKKYEIGREKRVKCERKMKRQRQRENRSEVGQQERRRGSLARKYWPQGEREKIKNFGDPQLSIVHKTYMEN
jgi:hypothetical protein